MTPDCDMMDIPNQALPRMEPVALCCLDKRSFHRKEYKVDQTSRKDEQKAGEKQKLVGVFKFF
jgi:hypothetical protein